MGRRYSIVSQCMQLLKQSDLPTINKLRVEVLLIKMKRLLLDEPHEVKLGESALNGLLSQMRGLRENCDGENLAELTDRISGLVAALSVGEA